MLTKTEKADSFHERARLQITVGKIVNLHKKGYSNKAISEQLDVSENMVKEYVTIYEDNKDRLGKKD